MKRTLSRYRCACCNRRLPRERYVVSRHTRNRFCWPGEGCQAYHEKRRRKREVSRNENGPR